MYKQDFEKAFGVKASENYERFFVPAIGKPLAEDLIQQAKLQAGETVLDVACGTGIVARLASIEMGSEGSVCGLDANPEMLAVARVLDETIDWYEASAEAIPLPDNTFDVILCQMGLQFVEDKPVAMHEMRRVLAPGGRLLLNVPGPMHKLFAGMAAAMRDHISEQAAGFVSRVFSLYEPAVIQKLAAGAGFNYIDVQTYNKELHLPGAKEFLWQYVFSTPLAAVVPQADEDAHAALEKDIIKRWQSFAMNGSIVYTQPMTTLTALK